MASACTGGGSASAKSVAAAASARTGGRRVAAKSVAAVASARTGGSRARAKSVAAVASVHTGRGLGRAFAKTVDPLSCIDSRTEQHYLHPLRPLAQRLALDDPVLPVTNPVMFLKKIPLIFLKKQGNFPHLKQQRLLRSVRGIAGAVWLREPRLCACFCLLAIAVVPAGGVVH